HPPFRVVGPAPVGVLEDLVGLVDGGHPIGRRRTRAQDVGVVFLGEPAVGGLDHLVLRLGIDLEDLVGVDRLVGHVRSFSKASVGESSAGGSGAGGGFGARSGAIGGSVGSPTGFSTIIGWARTIAIASSGDDGGRSTRGNAQRK